MTLFRHALPQETPDRFLLLDRVDSCDETGATARRVFTAAPPWQGLEAMAQLAALHARWTADFNLHAFLLTVEECTWPTAADLHGTLYIGADLLAQSDRAATYATVIAPLPPSSGPDTAPAPPCMAATLTIGHTPYDTRFNGATLTARYREIFAWLTRTT
ncbi:hypothetical protein [Nitratidesulfovibrio liaohensis]|uniref:Uncharacterized protein n=1 Tax=Nitratidesulfovibrio liaohensis TaxID=2604158 RepID=A0ABY9R5W4_9BACT|nr:hypothetical protein [Nitratidesulfovibrio liaohensis]WMW66607.1 hypothetical protein KPS_001207 [Nitratidesulfovibrio liaohensis]